MTVLGVLGVLALGSAVGCTQIRNQLEGEESLASIPIAVPPELAPAESEVESTPRGYIVMEVGGVAPTSQGNAVVLKNEDEQVGVPIFVGGTEALSIALRLKGQRYARPLTHDLLDEILGKLGGSVISARVDRLHDEVFHGSVLVRRGDKVSVVDARPSDAIALAIGNAAPIHVSQDVVDRVGVDISRFELMRPDELEEASDRALPADAIEL